jgi:hypothetical protein
MMMKNICCMNIAEAQPRCDSAFRRPPTLARAA